MRIHLRTWLGFYSPKPLRRVLRAVGLDVGFHGLSDGDYIEYCRGREGGWWSVRELLEYDASALHSMLEQDHELDPCKCREEGNPCYYEVARARLRQLTVRTYSHPPRMIPDGAAN